jgi:hypothetical protein
VPLYGAGRPDNGNVQQFCDGNVVLETINGVTRLYADDGDGNAPELTAADCAAIGAALTALGT